MLKVESIEKLATENPKGFTVNIRTGQDVVSGIVAAYAETQNSIGMESIPAVLAHAEANAGVVGGWLNSANGLYYFDSCAVFMDRSAAIAFGREQGQIAVFDLDELIEILL